MSNLICVLNLQVIYILKVKLLIKTLVVFIALLLIAVFLFVPSYIDNQKNVVLENVSLPEVSPEALDLHQSLVIGDWHSDSLMWSRDLMKENRVGHMDIPRLQKGNVALQMFTTVTKAPSGLNYETNDANTSDDITKLALVSLWPTKTWTSLTERSLYMSARLHSLAEENPKDLAVVTSKKSLSEVIERRKTNTKLVGALLGTEGSHALDGDLNNIEVLYDNGFRMMSLHHFFDNKLGGSLHGIKGGGLTEFGREAVKQMDQLNIIIDVAHSSEKVVEDVLALTDRPLVVSHTGFYGHCASPRNIPDNLMIQIANEGGLIAVGYWDGAVCEPTLESIAKSIDYGVNLVGADHISLGSDFDGSTEVPFDTSKMIYLTQALMDVGLSDENIAKVMGGNMLRFLEENLPD
ncbi:peptidase M19 [Alteromonadaceae bacterium M269]|nr:peptidase M19 [Alteromonadaceae bacterium M269]